MSEHDGLSNVRELYYKCPAEGGVRVRGRELVTVVI